MPGFEIIPQPKDFTGTDRPRVAKFRRPEPPTFSDPLAERDYKRGRLAAAARVVHNEGWGIGCSMCLSARDPVDLNTFWVLPSHKALTTMNAVDCMRITSRGEIIDGQQGQTYDRKSIDIHLAIYAAREDVHGIVHGHTPYGRAFSMKGQTISMICQDSCTFHKRISCLPLSTGLAASEHPEGVSETLGQGKGFVLSNRGLLTVGGAIECALSYYIRLENLCRAQLLAEAAARGRGGELVLVGEEEVAFTFENTGSEHHAWMMCMPYMARVERQTGGSHARLVVV